MSKYCSNCGSEVVGDTPFCTVCGAKNQAGQTNEQSLVAQQAINVTLATIVGYLIPGLPSILWFNQKKKGLTIIGVTVVGFIILQVFGNILLGIFGAIDAYKLSKRINSGEKMNEWTFFWDR